jgi:hypothetical protein
MNNNIVLNSKNLQVGTTNTFQYNFINGSFKIPKDSKLIINQLTVPYSWYNITSILGNNTFQYVMPTTGSTTTTITVVIPDGFYTLSDLNVVLQQSLKANNFFFYNITGSGTTLGTAQPVILYPITLTSFSANYTNNFTFYYIPINTINVQATYGSNWVWALGTFPTTATAPQIIITGNVSKSTTLFGNLIGFLSGTYPTVQATIGAPTVLNASFTVAGNTLTQINGPFPALGSTVNGVIIRCSLVDNKITMPSDILDSFPITSTFGSNINYLPISDNQIAIKEGTYSNFTVSFYDQNLNVLNMQDFNVLLSFIITLGQ